MSSKTSKGPSRRTTCQICGGKKRETDYICGNCESHAEYHENKKAGEAFRGSYCEVVSCPAGEGYCKGATFPGHDFGLSAGMAMRGKPLALKLGYWPEGMIVKDTDGCLWEIVGESLSEQSVRRVDNAVELQGDKEDGGE